MMKHHLIPAVALSASLITAPAMADENGSCWLSYHGFEEAVPHLDMPSCPGVPESREGKVFCRAVLSDDAVTVYRFRAGAEDSCLEAADSMPVNAFVKANGAADTP